MNIALRKSMTLEVLAWENRQGLKYEFDGSQPVAMNGVRLGIEIPLREIYADVALAPDFDQEETGI
jgi:hypothetical protein